MAAGEFLPLLHDSAGNGVEEEHYVLVRSAWPSIAAMAAVVAVAAATAAFHSRSVWIFCSFAISARSDCPSCRFAQTISDHSGCPTCRSAQTRTMKQGYSGSVGPRWFAFVVRSCAVDSTPRFQAIEAVPTCRSAQTRTMNQGYSGSVGPLGFLRSFLRGRLDLSTSRIGPRLVSVLPSRSALGLNRFHRAPTLFSVLLISSH